MLVQFDSQSQNSVNNFKRNAKNIPELNATFIDSLAWEKIKDDINKKLNEIKSKKNLEEGKIFPGIQISSNEFLQNIEDLSEKSDQAFGACQNTIEANKKKIEEINADKVKFKEIKSCEEEGSFDENYAKIKEEHLIYKQAKGILEEALKSITQKVLPQTINNLSKILPILTADRYKDAKVDETYQIQLFDSKRGDYVDKAIFSGGTIDQIALAFRLAFAMATSGASKTGESFIFLDEPLGFFDDERRNALIDFLTHGMISKLFAQRFVVSNYLMIKPYFDYIIEMENGMVQNMVTTDSVFSKSDSVLNYKSIQQQSIFQHKKIKSDGEDGFYQIIFELKNTANYEISNVTIENPKNLAIQLKPIYFTKIKPQAVNRIQLSFHRSGVEENFIPLNIKYKIAEDQIAHEESIQIEIQ